MRRELLLRPLLWVTLGAWIGGLAFFGAGVAPAVLRHAPSPVAGELVRATLAVLDWSGVAAGVLLAGTAVVLRRGALAAGVPLVLVALCLASQLWVAPAIAAARPSNATQQDSDSTDGWSFQELHRLSVSLYTATLAGAISLAVVHGRREASGASRGKTPT